MEQIGAGDPADEFPLEDGVRVTLDARGVQHPRAARGAAMVFTPYEEIAHLAASPRALWIGARRSVYVLPRARFASEHAPDRLVRALLGRMAELPGGAEQLQRLAEIDRSGRQPSSMPATWGLAGVCLAVFVAQLLGGDAVHDVGFYRSSLVDQGDWWRLLTANLLHGFPQVPIHLGMNLLGLIALGTLLERPLGSVRTLLVMGASGLGSMLASGLAGYEAVVGVSGVVFGLLGALTWLELRHGETLPAWWRVPRRALWWMYGVSAGLAVLFPYVIAGAAHLGGLLAGAGVAALTWRGSGRSAAPVERVAMVALLTLTTVAVFTAGGELLQPGDYSAKLARRIAELPDASPEELNNRAWFAATDPEVSEEMLSAALMMAERAVDETQREDATILDTLAEVHFVMGRESEALATIEEAIAQNPDERYYREQRRRFLGERADRPPAPGLPDPDALGGTEAETERGPETDPGLSV